MRQGFLVPLTIFAPFIIDGEDLGGQSVIERLYELVGIDGEHDAVLAEPKQQKVVRQALAEIDALFAHLVHILAEQ